MTGSILKRGDQKYLLRISIGVDPISKKRLYRTETFNGSKKDAERRLRELLAQFESGKLTKRQKLSMNEVVERWLTSMQPNLEARTHQDYEGLYRRYIRSNVGVLPIEKVTCDDIQDLYNNMIAKPLSALTVRRLHTVLSQVLEQARKWRIIAFNPASDVILPAMKAAKVAKPFEIAEARAFIEASHGHRLGAAFRMALDTGMRPQEYTALQWPDLDLETGIAKVLRTLFFPKGKPWRLQDRTKTESSRRAVALSSPTIEDLRRHQQAQAAERLALGESWRTPEHDFVFTNTQGGAISPSVLNNAYKDILKMAKLSTRRVYDLRHSHATFMFATGIPAKTVSDRLGHSNVHITLNTYTHLLPGTQKAAADQTAAMIFGDRVGE